jgi:hypothetical protein
VGQGRLFNAGVFTVFSRIYTEAPDDRDGGWRKDRKNGENF